MLFQNKQRDYLLGQTKNGNYYCESNGMNTDELHIKN